MRYVTAVLLFVAMNIWAVYEMTKALRNLRPEAPSKVSVLVSGYFAKREHFTDQGWRHRNNAIMLNTLSPAPVIVAIMWP